MNKKTGLYLLLLLALVAFGIYLSKSEPKTTLKTDIAHFAVLDTQRITKIFVADMRGNELLLEKKAGRQWWVNGKYRVERKVLMGMMDPIKNVRIKEPVPLKMRDDVIRELAGFNRKVEIYAEDGLIKTYYIGGNTADELGTFMYEEGLDAPYVTYIPGFNGYLTARFPLDMSSWRSRKVFQSSLKELQEIELKFNEKLEDSYSARFDGVGGISISSELLSPEEELNPAPVKRMAVALRRLHFEQIFGPASAGLMDSLDNAEPYGFIKLLNAGQEYTLSLYRVPATMEGGQDPRDYPLNTFDRAFAHLAQPDQSPVYGYVQTHSVDNFMPSLSSIRGRIE